MDWNYFAMIWLAVLLPLVRGWTAVKTDAPRKSASSTPSPYIDILFCAIREQPWSCAREQSARILDIWDAELLTRWQKLKVEADSQLNATLEKRGYSASEIPTREKPSTILKKIEIGSNFMKEYLAESMDGFLGRENEYLKESSSQQVTADDDDDEEDESDDDNNLGNEGDENDDDDEEEEAESDDNDDDKDDDNDDDNDGDNEVDGAAENDEAAQPSSPLSSNTDQSPSSNDNLANSSSGDEFIEIPDKQPEGQLKRPAFGGNKKKNKNKNRRRKKGQKGQPVTPATLVLVQQAPQPHEVHEHEAIQLHSGDLSGVGGGGGGGGHKLKQKRRKRKKHGQPGSVSTVVVEEAPSDHIGAQLLEELVGADLLPDVVGGKRKRKHKFPTKYGRSNGVTRTKKKKKRKALMKLILLGSFLKAKIELLLKILGAHLQIKFLAIALIGLLINVARFWIDVKRGGVPQKVVYVEHAHHQHHYEEHGDDWNEGGGGYWKRSLQTDHPSREESAEGGGGGGGHTDSYQPQLQPHYDAQYLAYRNQWHQRQ